MTTVETLKAGYLLLDKVHNCTVLILLSQILSLNILQVSIPLNTDYGIIISTFDVGKGNKFQNCLLKIYIFFHNILLVHLIIMKNSYQDI